MPTESGHRHAPSTEFDKNICAIGKPGYVVPPACEHPIPVFSIRADAQRVCHMVEYDGETLMGLRQKE